MHNNPPRLIPPPSYSNLSTFLVLSPVRCLDSKPQAIYWWFCNFPKSISRIIFVGCLFFIIFMVLFFWWLRRFWFPHTALQNASAMCFFPHRLPPANLVLQFSCLMWCPHPRSRDSKSHDLPLKPSPEGGYSRERTTTMGSVRDGR